MLTLHSRFHFLNPHPSISFVVFCGGEGGLLEAGAQGSEGSTFMLWETRVGAHWLLPGGLTLLLGVAGAAHRGTGTPPQQWSGSGCVRDPLPCLGGLYLHAFAYSSAKFADSALPKHLVLGLLLSHPYSISFGSMYSYLSQPDWPSFALPGAVLAPQGC